MLAFVFRPSNADLPLPAVRDDDCVSTRYVTCSKLRRSMASLLTWENAAALLGVINVALLVRRSIWNYPFGIMSVGLYGYVFYGVKLYSDAILQIYFFSMQFYGWWNWLHGRSDDGLARVETMSSQ